MPWKRNTAAARSTAYPLPIAPRSIATLRRVKANPIGRNQFNLAITHIAAKFFLLGRIGSLLAAAHGFPPCSQRSDGDVECTLGEFGIVQRFLYHLVQIRAHCLRLGDALCDSSGLVRSRVCKCSSPVPGGRSLERRDRLPETLVRDWFRTWRFQKPRPWRSVF